MEHQINIDFSSLSQGEEVAVLPMSLVSALVGSLPKVSEYKLNRELEQRLSGAKTLAERTELLKTAYMVSALQLAFEAPAEYVIPADYIEKKVGMVAVAEAPRTKS